MGVHEWLVVVVFFCGDLGVFALLMDFKEVMLTSPPELAHCMWGGGVLWGLIARKLPKLYGVGPVVIRPSTAKAPPIGKIDPFSKIAVTLEPVMRFRFPSRFRIS